MDSETLSAEVAEAFVTTGVTTPPWPDPHPDRSPLEEEYSRCLDPTKYRILAARVEAWSQALTGLGLAIIEETTDPYVGWQSRPRVDLNRAIWLRPVRKNTIPLLVGFNAVASVPETGVILGAGDPAVEVEIVPDCGCDACDSGSDDLLEQLDEHLLAVVNGTFVHMTTRKGTVFSTGDGWTASGGYRRGEVERLLTKARDGRSRHTVLHGLPWWDADA